MSKENLDDPIRVTTVYQNYIEVLPLNHEAYPMLLEESKKLHEKDGSGRLDVNPEISPVIQKYVDDFIVPRMLSYLRRHFGYDTNNYDTIVGIINDSVDKLDCNHHVTAALSAYLCVVDSNIPVTIEDPRGSVKMRWRYPPAIRNKFFSPIQCQPGKGSLMIVPSYIKHSISPDDWGKRPTMIAVDLVLLDR